MGGSASPHCVPPIDCSGYCWSPAGLDHVEPDLAHAGGRVRFHDDRDGVARRVGVPLAGDVERHRRCGRGRTAQRERCACPEVTVAPLASVACTLHERDPVVPRKLQRVLAAALRARSSRRGRRAVDVRPSRRASPTRAPPRVTGLPRDVRHEDHLRARPGASHRRRGETRLTCGPEPPPLRCHSAAAAAAATAAAAAAASAAAAAAASAAAPADPPLPLLLPLEPPLLLPDPPPAQSVASGVPSPVGPS